MRDESHIIEYKASGVMNALDDKEFSGSLLRLLERGVGFVRANSRKMWRKTALSRVEYPEYPERAVEEALVNALVHRDYLVVGGEIHIDIYDDRLEIVSPGGMYDGEGPVQDRDPLRIPSVRRNPIVADMFQRLDLMERRGSGLRKIILEYAERVPNPRHLKPSFVSGTSFSTILPSLTYGQTSELWAESGAESRAESRPESRPESGPEFWPETWPQSESQSESWSESWPKSWSGSFPPTLENRIVVLLSISPKGTGRLLPLLHLSTRGNSLRIALESLLSAGLIERTIPDKPTSRFQKYRLTDKGRAALANLQNAKPQTKGLTQ